MIVNERESTMFEITRCDCCRRNQKCAIQGGQALCERCCPALFEEIRAEQAAEARAMAEAIGNLKMQRAAEEAARKAAADAAWVNTYLPPTVDDVVAAVPYSSPDVKPVIDRLYFDTPILRQWAGL